ncbi:hypothetical protein [Halobacillus sp. Marseille-Q1614]|uniref:hypothetical protein n=1 Tax=Halobacillus sp. Marseille-Q1614 TaxID=2709134 RepID=UPI001570CA19|nr:hypothetical protein [Halobacillus sp. Marseille-Q1614]
MWRKRYRRNGASLSLSHFFFKKAPEKPIQEEVQEWVLLESEDELKQYFLDELLPFQLKGASSTLCETSFYDPVVKSDERLSLLLQRIPDNYLVMFQPVAELKEVPMDAEILLIGSYEIELITFLDQQASIVYPSKENYWTINRDGVLESIVSPLLRLNRTETFLRSVIHSYGLDFHYKKTVLGRNHTFQTGYQPYSTIYIDKHNIEQWLQRKKCCLCL